MITRLILIVIGLFILSCSPNQKEDEISGIYTREYSFTVVQPETANEIGVRTVRDTILIQKHGERFTISNRKWKFNDYDRQGWQDMAHSEDRPFQTYQANLDASNNSLSGSLMAPLYINTRERKLYFGRNDLHPFHQVEKVD